MTLTAPLASGHAGRRPGDRNHPGAHRRPQRLQRRRRRPQPRRQLAALRARARSATRPTRSRAAQRFQAITLTTPGTVELSVGRHPLPPPERLERSTTPGHFLSSDDKLNRIWYQGAYTNDTDMVPIGAVPNQTIPVILDGAKRDRRPWIGRPPRAGPDDVLQPRLRRQGLGLHQEHDRGVRRHARRPTARSSATSSNWTRLAAHGRVLLDELLDVLRARPGVVLPVLGRRAVRASRSTRR